MIAPAAHPTQLTFCSLTKNQLPAKVARPNAPKTIA